MANLEAQRELRIANNYIESIAGDVPDDRYAAKRKIMDAITAATKHLERARQLDPQCTAESIDVKTGEKITHTLDEVCARALFFEGFALNRFDDDRANINRAIDALQKAVSYSPRASYYTELARALKRAGHSSEAERQLQRALELDPENMEAHKIADGITHVAPPHNPSQVFQKSDISATTIILGLAAVIFIFGIITLISGGGLAGVSMIVVAMLLGALSTLFGA
jgi:tetratricopeptide (TPR) repeat protein